MVRFDRELIRNCRIFLDPDREPAAPDQHVEVVDDGADGLVVEQLGDNNAENS